MPPTRRQLLALGAAAAASACSSPPPAAGRKTTPPAEAGSGSPAPTLTATPHPSPTATTTAAPHGPATEVGHGPRTRNQVALTFHGAGDLATARAVLAELRRGGAHATVLAVGTWLRDDPAGGRLVLDGGHELGNHTEHHRPMRTLDAATAYAEIRTCADRLRRLLGNEGRWFRASGTQHTTPTIRRAAGRAGYATCLSYDVDSLDWTDPGSDVIVSTVLRLARPGSVVSLHLGHRGTVAALPALLDGLAGKGLRPVTVGELLA